MKELTRIFDLSKSEQRVVLIVMLALIVGGFVHYERRVHRVHVRAPTDKNWTEFGVGAGRWWRQFKIKHADAKALFSIVCTTVARSDHDALFRPLFASQINHRVRDRRIAIDAVGAAPEEQIARLERIEFK